MRNFDVSNFDWSLMGQTIRQNMGQSGSAEILDSKSFREAWANAELELNLVG